MLLKLGKLGSICSHYPSPDADADMSALGDRLEQTALHVLPLCFWSFALHQTERGSNMRSRRAFMATINRVGESLLRSHSDVTVQQIRILLHPI